MIKNSNGVRIKIDNLNTKDYIMLYIKRRHVYILCVMRGSKGISISGLSLLRNFPGITLYWFK